MCVQGAKPVQAVPVIVYVLNYWGAKGISLRESTEPMWEQMLFSTSIGSPWVRIALINAVLLYALEPHF